MNLAGVRVPVLQFVYECHVMLAEIMDFGASPDGRRRIIPITGGTFEGPEIRGQVLGIGADWSLARSDGAGCVEAAYFLRTDDGAIIRVVNKGVGAGPYGEPTPDGERLFMFTNPVFEAPSGKYDWLNKSMFVGTLGARADVGSSVLIRVFKIV
jgi:hypothetical protein